MVALGTFLVYPQHGPAEVVGRQTRRVGADEIDYLVLRVSVGDLTLMVPESSIQDLGLRDPMTAAEAKAILARLGEPHDGGGSNANGGWARKFKARTEQSRTGDPSDLAEVVRAIAAAESPSTAEKRLFDRCLAMLTAEIATALKLDKEAASARVAEALGAVPA